MNPQNKWVAQPPNDWESVSYDTRGRTHRNGRIQNLRKAAAVPLKTKRFYKYEIKCKYTLFAWSLYY